MYSVFKMKNIGIGQNVDVLIKFLLCLTLNLSAHINGSAVFSQSSCITVLMRYLFKILFAGYLYNALFHSRVLQTIQPSNCTCVEVHC